MTLAYQYNPQLISSKELKMPVKKRTGQKPTQRRKLPLPPKKRRKTPAATTFRYQEQSDFIEPIPSDILFCGKVTRESLDQRRLRQQRIGNEWYRTVVQSNQVDFNRAPDLEVELSICKAIVLAVCLQGPQSSSRFLKKVKSEASTNSESSLNVANGPLLQEHDGNTCRVFWQSMDYEQVIELTYSDMLQHKSEHRRMEKIGGIFDALLQQEQMHSHPQRQRPSQRAAELLKIAKNAAMGDFVSCKQLEPLIIENAKEDHRKQQQDLLSLLAKEYEQQQRQQQQQHSPRQERFLEIAKKAASEGSHSIYSVKCLYLRELTNAVAKNATEYAAHRTL